VKADGEEPLSHSGVSDGTRTAQKELFTFTNAEFADMHFVYGFCDGNFLAASREYQHLYPNRRKLSDVFSRRCIIISEEQAVSCRVHVFPVEVMCFISHMVAHKAALFRMFLRQDFLRLQHVVLCSKISCTLETKRLCSRN
jgi:hypothetical protein